MDLRLIACKYLNARLTPKACKINQEIAQQGIKSLVNGIPVLAIDDHMMDRAINCANCERYSLIKPKESLQKYIEGDMQPLIAAIETWFTRNHPEDDWHSSEEAREVRRAQNRKKKQRFYAKQGKEIKTVIPEERRQARHPKIDQAVWDICEEHFHIVDEGIQTLTCIINNSCPIANECAAGLDGESDEYIIPLNKAAIRALREEK